MHATFSSKSRTHDPVQYRFKKALSSAAIAALKTSMESTYNVAFIYSGNEYDYDVVMTGNTGEFVRAMNTLFPKGRSDILVQRSQF